MLLENMVWNVIVSDCTLKFFVFS